MLEKKVPGTGIEPVRGKPPQDFKSCVSANSTTPAYQSPRAPTVDAAVRTSVVAAAVLPLFGAVVPQMGFQIHARWGCGLLSRMVVSQV